MTPQSQRVFHVRSDGAVELDGVPTSMPEQGYVWIARSHASYEVANGEVQDDLQRLTGTALIDLHVSDLVSRQLPSHFDSTSVYDLLVFRRLLALPSPESPGTNASGSDTATTRRAGRHLVAPTIDTSPVGFAVFDRVLLSVHPGDCVVRDYFAVRLLQGGSSPGASSSDSLRGATRLPTSPADLMLRMVNHIVDSYLDLRRKLTRELGELQHELLNPKGQFHDWSVLLQARTALHTLEDACEDQRGAVQEWIDSLDEWPVETTDQARRERELLRVRSRDVLEHIERVLGHVRRLEQSAETAVQMHFSALSHRTNQIMRTLTVLTAIFLPLNLITGFFGMNFDALPLIHDSRGVWMVGALMVVVGVGLAVHFWRKRYLSSRG